MQFKVAWVQQLFFPPVGSYYSVSQADHKFNHSLSSHVTKNQIFHIGRNPLKDESRYFLDNQIVLTWVWRGSMCLGGSSPKGRSSSERSNIFSQPHPEATTKTLQEKGLMNKLVWYCDWYLWPRPRRSPTPIAVTKPRSVARSHGNTLEPYDRQC